MRKHPQHQPQPVCWLVTLSDFHCVCVSGPLQRACRPRDVYPANGSFNICEFILAVPNGYIWFLEIISMFPMVMSIFVEGRTEMLQYVPKDLKQQQILSRHLDKLVLNKYKEMLLETKLQSANSAD